MSVCKSVQFAKEQVPPATLKNQQTLCLPDLTRFNSKQLLEGVMPVVHVWQWSEAIFVQSTFTGALIADGSQAVL